MIGLIYADYIVLLSVIDQGFQNGDTKYISGEKKRKIKFNAHKSYILHVRQPHVPRTDYSLN